MLAETLLAAFVLAIVTGLIFGTIWACDRLFHQSSLRQGLQSDALRFAGLLKRDAALSDFWRANVCNRSNPGSLRRDGLSLVALSDWNDPAYFDPDTQLPQWDRYVVYYAPLENPVRLYRQIVQPAGLSPPLPLYADLPGNIQDQPAWNEDVAQSTVLSDSVRTFECNKILENGSVEVKLQLRRSGLKRANTNTQVVESLETTVTVRLQNTWPKI